MSQLKPIKARCLAFTYNCYVKTNNSKIVTVLGLVERPIGRVDKGRYWQVDREFEIRHDKTYELIEMSDKLPESRLMRIDDPDLKEEPKTVEVSINSDITIENFRCIPDVKL